MNIFNDDLPTRAQDYRKYTVPTVLCGKLVPTVLHGKLVPTVLRGKLVPTVLRWKLVPTVLCGNLPHSNRSAPWNIDLKIHLRIWQGPDLWKEEEKRDWPTFDLYRWFWGVLTSGHLPSSHKWRPWCVRNKIGKFGQLSEEGKLLNKFEKRIIRIWLGYDSKKIKIK